MRLLYQGTNCICLLSSILLMYSPVAGFAPPVLVCKFASSQSMQGKWTRKTASCVHLHPPKSEYASGLPNEDLWTDKEKNLFSFDTNEENNMSRISRRNALSSIMGAGASFSIPRNKSDNFKATAATGSSLSTTKPASLSPNSQLKPLIDLPMQRIHLPPKAGVGRDYIIVQLSVNGKGPFDFMVDSGLTTEMITPHLQKVLGLDSKKNAPLVKGLAAGGDTAGSVLVKLSGAALCCENGKLDKDDLTERLMLPLPPLYAVVSDFPQEHLDPEHDPVEGMLGMEMLDLFDVDFDFSAGRIRFWAPGTAAAAASRDGLEEIPAAILNESGLLGIRVKTADQEQPVLGIIDCGSSFSTINWAAAGFMGLPADRSAYRSEPSIMGLGVDGRPQYFPTKEIQLTFAGNAFQDNSSGRVQFEPPSDNWKPWDPVRFGIGDLPVFSELLGDGKSPYNGPAALIGLDVLAQRRFILETGKTRRRRMFMSQS